MTKSSVDRKRSRYGEKYSLRFYKQLKIYHLTCNDEIPSLIAKFVETDGYLAMKLFERLESNYKENEQLKQSISDWSGSYDGLYEDVKRLEKENEQLKKQLASINRLIDNKIDEFKKGDYGDLPCNTIHMFLDLKQELGDLE